MLIPLHARRVPILPHARREMRITYRGAAAEAVFADRTHEPASVGSCSDLFGRVGIGDGGFADAFGRHFELLVQK